MPELDRYRGPFRQVRAQDYPAPAPGGADPERLAAELASHHHRAPVVIQADSHRTTGDALAKLVGFVAAAVTVIVVAAMLLIACDHVPPVTVQAPHCVTLC